MIGVSEEKFWDSTPTELEPYILAHQKRQKEQADLVNFAAWLCGGYFRDAIASSIFVAGLPSKTVNLPKYPKEPYKLESEQEQLEGGQMTEKQLEMARLRERIKMDTLCRALKERFANGR